MQFQIKTINNVDIENELKNIGFDTTYLKYAVDKHRFLTLKIENLKPHHATIIKQAALSNGTDASIHKDVLLNNIDNSSLILSGSIKQLKAIADSLSKQQFRLPLIAKGIISEIDRYLAKSTPLIMGILNITPDSSSDGGKYMDTKAAIAHANEMINNGADIIDIGAESTRPDALEVDSDTEIKRLLPVVQELVKNSAVKVSIDTRHSDTARKMIDIGVDIINDVSGLEFDHNMQDVLLDSDCDVVVMHSRGTPQDMDKMCDYKNLSYEIYSSLFNKIDYLTEAGFPLHRLIADVGFGFAKNVEQNYELLKRINEFNSIGVRLLAGTSRKRLLKKISGDDMQLLDTLTAVSSFYLAQNNVSILRVHNVEYTKLALELYKSIYLQKSCL